MRHLKTGKVVTSLVAFSTLFCIAPTQSLCAATEAVTPEKQVEKSTSVAVAGHQVQVEGRLGLGYLTGESKELVYNTQDGSKVSELIWTLDNIFMLNAGVSVAPKPWLKINADIWFKINDGDGEMDDYDWLYPGLADWSDWSHTEDVPLEKGLMFDINAEFSFYKTTTTSFTAFVGYKHDNWQWKAYGGDYVYSYDGFRDQTGSFPAGELGITYEQWWNVPYIGIGFESHFTNWELSGRLIGSPLVQAEDEDHHHMRSLRFEEDFDNSNMWAIDLSATYLFSQQFGVTGAFSYQYYDEAKGTTTITDLVTGEQVFIDGDAAGADNEATLFSLIFVYRF